MFYWKFIDTKYVLKTILISIAKYVSNCDYFNTGGNSHNIRNISTPGSYCPWYHTGIDRGNNNLPTKLGVEGNIHSPNNVEEDGFRKEQEGMLIIFYIIFYEINLIANKNIFFFINIVLNLMWWL